ncbi:MAG: nucleotide exchange factor GrpE [Patescibacteria group bacterium]
MEEEKQQQLEEKLALAEKERDEYLNGWKRAKADLINSKREFGDQLKNINDFAKTEFIKQFLPVLDALAAAGEIAGWQAIRKLAADVLVKNGVEEIAALGQTFDPVCHEAVGEAEGEDGRVVAVLQTGYKVNGQVIRAAKVKVGKNNFNK